MSPTVVISGGGNFPPPWLIYEAVCLIPPLSRRLWCGEVRWSAVRDDWSADRCVDDGVSDSVKPPSDRSRYRLVRPRRRSFHVDTDWVRLRYDTRCARKPTRVSLIYRTEPTTKKCKTEKLKSKRRICSEVTRNSLRNPCSQSWRRKVRLQWEGRKAAVLHVHPTRRDTGHFGDVLPSQPLGLVSLVLKRIGNESVPIQLAQCRFHGLAISKAKI